MACKAENVAYLALYRKFADPRFREHGASEDICSCSGPRTVLLSGPFPVLCVIFAKGAIWSELLPATRRIVFGDGMLVNA